MIRTAHIAPRTFAASLIRALDWLADRDAAYRERRKLDEMPAERLADMGLERGPDRSRANARFLAGPGSRRADAQAPHPLRAARLG